MALDELRAVAARVLQVQPFVPPQPAAMVRQLEDRILLSAAPGPAVGDGATVDGPVTPAADERLDLVFAEQPAGSNDAAAQASGDTEVQAANRRELVILDPSVKDHGQFAVDVLGAGDAFELFVLDPSLDGIEQISDALQGRQDLNAIHFLTHGTAGAVKLGNAWLSLANHGGYVDDIASWRHALSADADLLFYGCDVAGSVAGQSLLESLAENTGADVAASTNHTGAREFGGDWELEFQTGDIESEVALSGSLMESWHDLLGVITVNTTNDVLDGNTSSVAALLGNAGADGFISLREAIIATNNTAGADTIFLPSGTFTFAIGGGTEDAALTGDLDIADSLTILGAGPGLSIIDATGMDRVLHVLAGGSAMISDVIIRGGAVPANRWGAGMCVENAASANLSRVVITGNSAGSGAGLYNNRTLFAIDTILSNNSVADSGRTEPRRPPTPQSRSTTRPPVPGSSAKTAVAQSRSKTPCSTTLPAAMPTSRWRRSATTSTVTAQPG